MKNFHNDDRFILNDFPANNKMIFPPPTKLEFDHVLLTRFFIRKTFIRKLRP